MQNKLSRRQLLGGVAAAALTGCARVPAFATGGVISREFDREAICNMFQISVSAIDNFSDAITVAGAAMERMAIELTNIMIDGIPLDEIEPLTEEQRRDFLIGFNDGPKGILSC